MTAEQVPGTNRRALYFCDYAWLGGPRAEPNVLVATSGPWIDTVTVGAPAPGRAVHLSGLTLPGFANAHSHAFHRALRGVVQAGRGDFWSWREVMYSVASTLDPGSYYRLALATYAEMVLSGYTAVGEFHYLHHQAGGRPYADPNEMGRALLAAAADAGLRITLLDTCYLASGPGEPPVGVQARFSDGSARSWADRVAAMGPIGATGDDEGALPAAMAGAAVHSVRAVPPHDAAVVAAHATTAGWPLHFHLSEQVRENQEAMAAYGRSPAAILDGAGALGPGATAVHATHLSAQDVAVLGRSGTNVCMCPSTERDLADGIGPALALADAGSPLCLGSDSHALTDPFAEMRGLEHGERLASGHRGNWPAADLLVAGTVAGHAALGWSRAGSISPGSVADLVTLSLDRPHMAAAEGHAVQMAVFAAGAADVDHVVSGGRVLVSQGRHLLVPDVGRSLRAAISQLVPG